MHAMATVLSGAAGQSGLVLGFLPNLSPMELIIILFIGIMLFWRKLPEVGRSLGKGIVEFKKGIRGIEEEVDEASVRQDRKSHDDRIDVESPRFEIPRESAAKNRDSQTV